VTVLGHRGMLGSIVERRWREQGWDGDYVVNCLPDDLNLIDRLASRPGLIQPSSDAAGEDTPYGRTKLLIELRHGRRASIIRSGIVDILRQPDVAFVNWWCNPLTPLEWADLAWERRRDVGIHVAGRLPMTRWEVCQAVAEVFGMEPPEQGAASTPLDRIQHPDRRRPPLRDALIEYRDWLAA
jgi:hypothetical protein